MTRAVSIAPSNATLIYIPHLTLLGGSPEEVCVAHTLRHPQGQTSYLYASRAHRRALKPFHTGKNDHGRLGSTTSRDVREGVAQYSTGPR